jgi:hypothetical protein
LTDNAVDTDTAVWSSTNGLDWTEIGSHPLLGVQLSEETACREYIGNLLSAGALLISYTGLSFPCSEGRVVTHGTQRVSIDGQSWKSLDLPQAAPPEERGSGIHSAVTMGDQVVLVGQVGTRATFWRISR